MRVVTVWLWVLFLWMAVAGCSGAMKMERLGGFTNGQRFYYRVSDWFDGALFGDCVVFVDLGIDPKKAYLAPLPGEKCRCTLGLKNVVPACTAPECTHGLFLSVKGEEDRLLATFVGQWSKDLYGSLYRPEEGTLTVFGPYKGKRDIVLAGEWTYQSMGQFPVNCFSGTVEWTDEKGDRWEGASLPCSGRCSYCIDNGTMSFARYGEGTLKKANGSEFNGFWLNDTMISGSFTCGNGDQYTVHDGARHHGFDRRSAYGGWDRGLLLKITTGHDQSQPPRRIVCDGINISESANQMRMSLVNGPTFVGKTVSLVPSNGRMEWPDGRVFDGDLHELLPEGRGRMVWPEGVEYDGQWKAGHRDGAGVMKYKDGEILRGVWGDDMLQGPAELVLERERFDLVFKDNALVSAVPKAADSRQGYMSASDQFYMGLGMAIDQVRRFTENPLTQAALLKLIEWANSDGSGFSPLKRGPAAKVTVPPGGEISTSETDKEVVLDHHHRIDREVDEGSYLKTYITCSNGRAARVKFSKSEGRWYVANTVSSDFPYNSLAAAIEAACR